LEKPVGKKSVKKQQKREAEKRQMELLSKPWISMRTGIIVLAVVSIGMTILTAYQAIPVRGVLEGILWGLFFGGATWLVFLGYLLFNRFVRGKR
jgi:hypothetical protein